MDVMKLLSMPSVTGRDGIHICAQLRIDGMQLQDNRIGWAANTMERAAKHIEALENLLLASRPGVTTDQTPEGVTT